MKWSQLISRIRDLLAESVRDRIDFGITRYGRSKDASRGWITIDKVEVLNLSTIEYNYEWYGRHREEGWDYGDGWKELNDANVFAAYHLILALREYLNLAIDAIQKSDDPLIRAFGMLDARMGNPTGPRLAESQRGRERKGNPSSMGRPGRIGSVIVSYLMGLQYPAGRITMVWNS